MVASQGATLAVGAATAPSSGDACPVHRLAQFLARHPALDRLLTGTFHSRVSIPVVALIARNLGRRVRKTSMRELVDAFACPIPTDDSADFESRFLARLTASPQARDRVAAFLEDLGSLHPRVRAGLLRAWIHAGAIGSVQRETQQCRDRATGVERAYPLDVMVAAFGSCNLTCKGCYTAAELGAGNATLENLDFVVDELERVHVAHISLVGRGEPFFDQASRRLLFDIAQRHPQMLFTVYTNGTNIEADDIRGFCKTPNLIPLVSFDGPEPISDWRRGPGVFRQASETLRGMKEAGLLFGYISTVFRQNLRQVLNPAFVGEMEESGCRFGVYSLFLTFEVGASRAMMLSAEEREHYARDFAVLQRATRIPLFDIDGMEAHVGCRARHGATLFIDAIEGRVAPCVRDSSSSDDCNLFRGRHPGRLVEILDSAFFRQYRADTSGRHRCAAFERADGAKP